jgi:uncharacterized membrane protein YeaQ/YmgE (transglycosylase-associated protein family)
MDKLQVNGKLLSEVIGEETYKTIIDDWYGIDFHFIRNIIIGLVAVFSSSIILNAVVSLPLFLSTIIPACIGAAVTAWLGSRKNETKFLRELMDPLCHGRARKLQLIFLTLIAASEHEEASEAIKEIYVPGGLSGIKDSVDDLLCVYEDVMVLTGQEEGMSLEFTMEK